MSGAATGRPRPAVDGERRASGSTAAPVVELVDVVKRRASRDRSFELAVPRLGLRPGAAVAFVGPSGSGKSTLINLLAMTLAPDHAAAFRFTDPRTGAVEDVMALWHRRRLDALARLRGSAFGYVLQTGGLLPFLSVSANIALPQRLVGRPNPEQVAALARRLAIDKLMDERPADLSVGQRQRVAIARALAHNPVVVLADEPTASLDPVNARAVMDLFMELIATLRIALVVATHDAGLVARYGLPVIDGRVEERGTTTHAEFVARPPADAEAG